MRVAVRALVVLLIGCVIGFGLYRATAAEFGTGMPFGPNGINPHFMSLMGTWQALGGSAPSLDTSALGAAGGPGAMGASAAARAALSARDGVQLGKAASDGGRYAVLVGLGLFIGIVVEVVWRELAKPS